MLFNLSNLQTNSSDGSTTITAGGTAQTLFAGATPTHGFSIGNPDPKATLWFSDSVTAAVNGVGSLPLSPGGFFETPFTYSPLGPVSIISSTTGAKITARSW